MHILFSTRAGLVYKYLISLFLNDNKDPGPGNPSQPYSLCTMLLSPVLVLILLCTCWDHQYGSERAWQRTCMNLQ